MRLKTGLITLFSILTLSTASFAQQQGQDPKRVAYGYFEAAKTATTYEKKVENLEQAIKTNPDDYADYEVPFLEMLAQTHYKAEKFAEAEKAFQRLLDEYKQDDPKLIMFKGHTFYNRKLFEEAEKIYEAAIAINPQTLGLKNRLWTTRRKIADKFYRAKDYGNSLVYLDQLVVQYPKQLLFRYHQNNCHDKLTQKAHPNNSYKVQFDGPKILQDFNIVIQGYQKLLDDFKPIEAKRELKSNEVKAKSWTNRNLGIIYNKVAPKIEDFKESLNYYNLALTHLKDANIKSLDQSIITIEAHKIRIENYLKKKSEL